MNRYQETFEKLATRGTPVGATELLERVEFELSDHVHLVEVPRRRLSGPVVAVVAFGAVLFLGALWSLVAVPTRDSATEPVGSGIEWIRLDVDEEMRNSVTAGPGGFIRSPFVLHPEGPGIEFSVDGRTWRPVELPALRPMTLVREITATSETWSITVSDDGDRMDGWVSPDGVTWTAVVWPEGLGGTIGEVIAAGEGFFAVSRDAFGAGTTLWWSPDGLRWSLLEDSGPGDPDQARLWGTAAGIVASQSAPASGSSVSMFHSVDGTIWIEGRIELPTEFSVSPTRFQLVVVEYVGGQWIAIGEIERTAADPILYVWVSQDGVDWTPQGVPEFGSVDSRAVLVFHDAIVTADQLAVAPGVVPLSVRDDGILTASGTVASTREIWVTNDGASWTKVLNTDVEIVALASRTRDDGTEVGVWIGRPQFEEEQPVVTTTALSVEARELEQEGLDLQSEILADGKVTRDEFERALDGWKACMERRGLFDVSFEISPQGGWSSSYATQDRFAGDAEDAACSASYVDEVADGVGG